MKKTLLFSNIVGDILCSDISLDYRFNNYMEEYLSNNIEPRSIFVFIDAPGFGNEENYLSIILKCFKNVGVIFDKVISEDYDLRLRGLSEIDKERVVYFLMGGNPLTQIDIIRSYNLEEEIKNYDGLVIGFCAGAINLSKYSIITTDADFDKPLSYLGINRVGLCIEPHYNINQITEERSIELIDFSEKYATNIIAIPDESILIIEDDKIIEKGIIHKIRSKN